MSGFDKIIEGRARRIGPTIEQQQDPASGHPQSDARADSGDQFLDEGGDPMGSEREREELTPEEEIIDEHPDEREG
jgi:hypothetical protein